MKGMDATILLVCKAFKLKTIALPVFDCEREYREYMEEEDWDDERDELLQDAADPQTLFSSHAAKKQRVETEENNNCDINIDWIGAEFREIFEDGMGFYEDSIFTRLKNSDAFRIYKGIHWLNGPKYFEKNLVTVYVRPILLQLVANGYSTGMNRKRDAFTPPQLFLSTSLNGRMPAVLPVKFQNFERTPCDALARAVMSSRYF